ncbi:U3 small nucleolar RNA-associated protein 14 A, partial [Asbolus verrucosus]
MDSDASENYEYLYEDSDASKHDKLVEKVLSLNKTQHLKKPSRTEPSLHISEFDLVKSITGEKGSVQINELTKVLKNRKSRVKIGEGVKKVHKSSHTLPKPLEKPQADRIRRSVAYEKARLELDRWEAVVTSNRVSTNLSFPLDSDVNLSKKEAENFTSMWRLKSSLEQELEKVEPKVEEFHIDLEQEKFPLTMKEMLARRREAAKLRAFQGYKEAKARRQNKIKSKKYHRIQKREKIKQKLKEFEQLQKTDPELALKKLEEIEKSRAEERFSLRHKSTGKWARNKQIRAKYDKESRQVLAQQLTIGRELTQKLKSTASDSEEENEETEANAAVKNDENNPWVNGIKPDMEVADFVSSYRKYWTENNKNEQELKEDTEKLEEHPEELRKAEVIENKEPPTDVTNQECEKKTIKKKQVKKKKVTEPMNESQSTSEWEVSIVGGDTTNIDDIFNRAENKIQKKRLKNIKRLKNQLKVKKSPKGAQKEKENPKKVDLSLPSQVKKPIIDEELTNHIPENEKNKDMATLKKILSSEIKKKESNPNTHPQAKTTNLSTTIPDILTTEENEEDVNQREIISEAFEDDDIVQEFQKEKKNEIDKDKPNNINLSLPGWGSWGGTNIKISKRKKRRFTIKMPEKMPRRDDNKGSLIINENAQNKIKEHMVSEVPFPFKTVKDFEASIRAPISNTFVPETAYRKLIKPAVTTKMGTIIEPMSKDILLNKN